MVYFVRADHIGRPVFATTGAGTVVWRASYKPFGGVSVTTGTPPDDRFPGQWFQTETGPYQNWMRDYDPSTAVCRGFGTSAMALLHKPADGRSAPSPGPTYPTTFVTGMPSAV